MRRDIKKLAEGAEKVVGKQATARVGKLTQKTAEKTQEEVKEALQEELDDVRNEVNTGAQKILKRITDFSNKGLLAAAGALEKISAAGTADYLRAMVFKKEKVLPAMKGLEGKGVEEIADKFVELLDKRREASKTPNHMSDVPRDDLKGVIEELQQQDPKGKSRTNSLNFSSKDDLLKLFTDVCKSTIDGQNKPIDKRLSKTCKWDSDRTLSRLATRVIGQKNIDKIKGKVARAQNVAEAEVGKTARGVVNRATSGKGKGGRAH